MEGLRSCPAQDSGIVCYITVAGFLTAGFQKMRDYLRRTCDDIWVIDCSPEGHQPEVNTRIFQGVQQPVCIVMASDGQKRVRCPRESRFPNTSVWSPGSEVQSPSALQTQQ